MFKRTLKKITLIYIILITLFLTGCWDKQEIDDRAFILAMGIDHVTPGHEGEREEMEEILTRKNHYRVTYVFPKQMMGVGEAEMTNVQISSVGENVYMTERQLTTRMDSELFLGHLKSVVVGEEVVNNPKMFREVLDALEKDPFITRKISFAIVEGEAKEALEVEPKLEPMTGQFIADLFRGRERTQRAPIKDLNEILIELHSNKTAVIPRMVVAEEELKVGGSAIINDYRLVGWLGEIETIMLMLVRGQTTIFNVTVEDGDVVIPYQITEAERKFTLVESGDQLKMRVEIDLEGDIIQHYFNPENDMLDPVFLQQLQSKINQKVHDKVAYTIKELQEKHRTDVVGFNDYVRKHHSKLWKKVEGDWADIFPTIEVEVVVDAKVRRVGLSK